MSNSTASNTDRKDSISILKRLVFFSSCIFPIENGEVWMQLNRDEMKEKRKKGNIFQWPFRVFCIALHVENHDH